MTADRRALGTVAAVVASVCVVAIASRVVFGPGYLGYDAAWALVWGGQLADGALPDYEAPVAPTPHPLANLAAVPLSLLGDGGVTALIVGSYLAWAALLACVVALGGRLGGWIAGVVAAVLIASIGVLQREVAFASIDVPFLALIAAAGWLEVTRPRRGWSVLAVLALAGLLRPEAWLLSAAYLVWLHPRRWTKAGVGFAVAGPVLWMASDLLVTGNPLFSLVGTRALAADLERPTGLRTAIFALPSALESLLGVWLLVAGLLALLAGLVLARKRFAGLAVVFGLGLATFAALGAASLPVLLRYLLLPACVLALAAAVALTLGRGRWKVALAVVVGALLVAALPGRIGQLDDAQSFTRARHAVHDDLLAAARTPAFRAAARRCPVVRVPDFRARPFLVLAAPVQPGAVEVGNLPDGETGLLLTPASDAVAAIFTLGAPDAARRQATPLGARLVVRNASWIVYATC